MYNARLKNLKPKDVLHLISTLPAHVDVKFGSDPIEAPTKANGKARNPGMKDPIKLGPNFAKANNDTLNGKIVAIVTKYEAEHGAGSMHKYQLRDKMKKESAAPEAAINLALSKGIITGA